MKSYHLKKIDIEQPVPENGEPVEVRIHQSEQDEFLYLDLTQACMLTENLKSAIRFSDFEFEENPEASDYAPKGLIKLSGVVEDGHRFIKIFRDFQKKIGDEDNLIGDQIENFIAEQDGRWLSSEVVLPKLFRATRIEQLLAWLQNDDLVDEEKALIAEELVAIEPNLASHHVIDCYLNN
jgi:hypothetical protein